MKKDDNLDDLHIGNIIKEILYYFICNLSDGIWAKHCGAL